MKYIRGILVAGFLSSMLGATPDSADALFAQGHWQAALTAYTQGSIRTPGVCVRMGECARALKEYPQALAYWYEAQQGLYFLLYYEIALRIAHLESQIGLGGAAATPLWIASTAAASIPPLLWQILALLCVLFFVWKVRRWWAARAWYALLAMMIAIGCLGSAAWLSVSCRTRMGAVVVASTALRSGPDERYSEVGMLSLGSAVKCLGTARIKEGPVYYKVQGPYKRGWIDKEKLIIIGQKAEIKQ